MQCIVDGLAAEYQQSGKGPDLVMLHGWRANGATFDDLSSELKNQYCITMLDLPNFGKSQFSDRVVSVDDYANFLKHFLEKLEISDYILLGHSMGGQIAVYATGSAILKPNKLILLASAGVRDFKSIKKRSMKLAAKTFGPLTPAKIKRRIYKRIGSDYSPDLSPLLKEVIDNMLSTDTQAEAIKIIIPTLLIYGLNDRHTPAYYGEILHEQITDSHFEQISGADHWLHQTHARQIANLIKDF